MSIPYVVQIFSRALFLIMSSYLISCVFGIDCCNNQARKDTFLSLVKCSFEKIILTFIFFIYLSSGVFVQLVHEKIYWNKYKILGVLILK